MEQNDFWVECNVCKIQYKNWSGSTPCCGSIAWIVDEVTGKPTKNLSIFASINSGPIEPVVIPVK